MKSSVKKLCEYINNRLTKQSSFWLLSLFVIFIYRWKYRLIEATLWAEDGARFLSDAFEHGAGALVMPYDGYFHAIPRIIAHIASLFPTGNAPHVLILFCFFITYYVISTILRKDYDWLIPDFRFRGVLMVLLAVAPGTTEAFGNIANLHWVLYLYLGLLALRSTEYRYKLREIILAVFIILSEGATITLIPLFIIRIIFQKLRKKDKRTGMSEIIIVISLVVMALMNFLNRTQGATNIVDITLLGKVFVKTVLAEFISFAWLHDIPYTTMASHWFIITIYVAVFAFAVIAKNISSREKFIFPLVFFGCISLIPPMIAAVRPINAELFLAHPRESGLSGWLMFRYSFLTCAGGYIFWIWILSLIQQEKPQIAKYMCFTLVTLALMFCFKDYTFIQPIEKINYWSMNASKINGVRHNSTTKKITIPTQPDGCSITVGEGKEKVSINEIDISTYHLEDLKFCLDKISVENKFLNITGWAFKEKEQIIHSNTSYLLKMDSKFYQLNTTNFDRPDVQASFKEQKSITACGINARVSEDFLKAGDYSIYILYSSNNKKILCNTDSVVHIE